MNKRIPGGVMAVLVGLTLAGCSSSSSSSSTTGSPATPTTSVDAATTTSTTTESASPPTGAATARALGAAYVALLPTGDPGSFCTAYAVASQVSACRMVIADSGVTFSHMALGTVTVNGDHAVITTTGTACKGTQCISNADANRAMAGGIPFVAAYASADNPDSPTGSPFVGAAVRVGGRWFARGF